MMSIITPFKAPFSWMQTLKNSSKSVSASKTELQTRSSFKKKFEEELQLGKLAFWTSICQLLEIFYHSPRPWRFRSGVLSWPNWSLLTNSLTKCWKLNDKMSRLMQWSSNADHLIQNCYYKNNRGNLPRVQRTAAILSLFLYPSVSVSLSLSLSFSLRVSLSLSKPSKQG